MIEQAQRRAARVAGLAYVLTLLLVVAVNFGISQHLLVPGSVLATARDIVANERLFRVGLAGDVLYAAGLLVLLSAFYVVLRPVSRGLALLAAISRLVYAGTWLLIALNAFIALRLLGGADFSRALGADGAQALAHLYLNGYDPYYVGLFFWGMAAAVGGWLWLKSRYIPAVLALLGLITAVWCMGCTLLLYFSPGLPAVLNPWFYDSPMVLAELAIALWLLVAGLRDPGSRERVPVDTRPAEAVMAGSR